MTHIPSKCPFCGGSIEKGTTTFTADLQTGVVVVRNVPALVCSQCGEDWLEDSTAENLEAITQRARAQKTQLEMISM